MRGAPAKVIRELAGHESLTTTQRYMHLSPAAKDAAIGLLDMAGPHLPGDGLRDEGNGRWVGKDEGPGTDSRSRALLLARSTGLEPVASGVTGRRSNQLN